MLGRQQIAGASTALSELFKNAHDAYANHAEVDHFRSDGLLVIRDDGYGMTRDEFEGRWLVLGTESKIKKTGDVSRYVPNGYEPRAVMGEKGIGRLAIAILGRQVLVLTRAKRENGLHDLVACYIHWGLFELPGVNLEDIEIPIGVFESGTLPNGDDIKGLLSTCKSSVESLLGAEDQDQVSDILEDLGKFQVDPVDLDEFLEGLSLKKNGHGTHFFVAPANETISINIDREKKDRSKDFSKFLLGFCNSTFIDQTSPPIRTRFRDWVTEEGPPEELIEHREFFTPEELDKADHRMTGRIDEHGQFRGNVRIYDREYSDHIINWREGGGKSTLCGPFEIEFGYLQGNQRESMMPPEDWKRLSDKMNQIGGLYIYRDRIRMLPYGDPGFDWAGIEFRRTKSASYYFFSHRRMFGAICLSQEQNSALHEKAGREGFQEDRAYRQLRAIIENLFLQLATDFFREGSSEASEEFASKRSEIEKKELARRRREKTVSTKKKKLTSELEVFFDHVGNGLPSLEIEELGKNNESRMRAAAKMQNPDDAAEALLEAERLAYRQLEDIREKYRLKRPRGIGLSRDLTREWDAYSVESEKIENDIFEPFAKNIAATLGTMATEAKLLVDQRKRVQTLLDQLADDNLRNVRERRGEVKQKADETTRKAIRTASDALEEFKHVVGEVNEDLATQDFSQLLPDDIESLRERLELKISEVGGRNSEMLASIRDLLANVSENLSDTGYNQLDVLEAIEGDLEGLREQSDSDAELVQLGLAVAIINHEFEASIKSIRGSLRQLHQWARHNDEIAPLYSDIRASFDHLDGHLNLFTPLQRRLYRRPVEVKGSDIYHYLTTLFESRMTRHEVKIQATEAFLKAQVTGYPSSIYPVFVNIVDNAIYWLKVRETNRLIMLDSDGRSFSVSNNGSNVHKRDIEGMFEQGFSRKPGGRGLGLFISRKALRREGMDLMYCPDGQDGHVTFKIIWQENESQNS